MAFAGVEVSSTKIAEEQREQIRSAITRSGGTYSGSFSSQSHALVAHTVGSDKYCAAVQWGVPVVRPEWVLESCAQGRVLDKAPYAVRALEGLHVCLTGIGSGTDPSRRLALVATIEHLGGHYSGALLRYKTTHLVAERLDGEKVAAARLWSADARGGPGPRPEPPEQLRDIVVKIVKPEWIEACAAAGHFIPEGPFELKDDDDNAATAAAAAAAAVDGVAAAADATAVAAAAAAAAARAKQAEREQRKRMRDAQTAEREAEAARQADRLAQQLARESTLVEQFKASGALLGCLRTYRIFMHGLDVRRWRTLRFLAQCAGAVLLYEYNSLVTHVLLGNTPNADYVATLRKNNPALHFIEPQLITDCLTLGARPSPQRDASAGCDNSTTGASREQEQPPRPPHSTTTLTQAQTQAQTQTQTHPQHRVAQDDSHATETPTNRELPHKLHDMDMASFLVGIANGHAPIKRSKTGPTRLQPLKPSTEWAKRVLCVSKYLGADRLRVEEIAHALGATYVERLTRKDPQVTHLITPDRESEKAVMAIKWGIPMFDLQWLEGQLASHLRCAAR
jgi:hypothetical protein